MNAKAKEKEKKEEKKTAKKEAPKKKKEEKKEKKKTTKSSSGAALSIDEIIASIEQMTMLELSELVGALEDKFGVSASMPVVAAGAAGGGGEDTAEEKDEFTVMLKEVGGQKIQVIKAVRQLTDLGLKEAKALVDNAPKPIKENVSKDEAEEAKKALEEAGATVALE